MIEMKQEKSRWPRLRSDGLRLALFSLISNSVVVFTFQFGLFLWPQGLPGGTQNFLWLASGVNTAGLLLLGLRYWPILLLNAFSVWWLIPGEAFAGCVFGALGNALEALGAAWLIRCAGKYGGGFDSVRVVGVLVIASLLAPFANTLIMPLYLCGTGVIPWEHYPESLGNWHLANGVALLTLTPLLTTLAGGNLAFSERVFERLLAALVTACVAFIAFRTLFLAGEMNVAFLIFLPVIYVAVRFGVSETAIALGVVLLVVYGVQLAYAGRIPVAEAPRLLWFAQAIIWVLAATGLLVAALGAERSKAERQLLEASLSAERARLAVLRYQINPHFLFNTLNSIRASLPLREVTAREMITSLAAYLRSTLEGEALAAVPLREEIESVKEYLHIQAYRFGPRLEACFEISSQVEAVSVPAFILQPLVENAIRHGLEAASGVCMITIRAEGTGNRLRLSVVNTGVWRPLERGAGIGLENVRSRLELSYRGRASLAAGQLGDSVCVTLLLPR